MTGYGRKAWDVVAYKALAALLCPRCAVERYDVDLDADGATVLDSEGNDVSPVFVSDEGPHGPCDRCGADLDAS